MSTEPQIIPPGEVLPPMVTATKQARRAAKPKRKHRDRFGMVNTFTDCTLAGLSRAEIAVWLVLWRDSRKGVAQTGQTDIARRAGICRRTVYNTIGRLAGKGLVTVVHRGGLRRGASCYRVHPVKSVRTHGQ